MNSLSEFELVVLKGSKERLTGMSVPELLIYEEIGLWRP
ncbi:hypothetical protein EYM_02395 [Ignicoccus islandicus DSM 13165]|uniref:Uncharacterized protein n=1 Tax=Ignicoccus islandicus DSM 13165 TaxID=940295 RepID=A0A0U3FS48_9CREN|nr:hypothetical protein EYM_02395 [Ignicoccus islandicus DSM 13165]